MSDHSNTRNKINTITSGRQVKQKEPTETIMQGELNGQVEKLQERKTRGRIQAKRRKQSGQKWTKP
jgi:hypothetical protein